jgi:hypothetical protein
MRRRPVLLPDGHTTACFILVARVVARSARRVVGSLGVEEGTPVNGRRRTSVLHPNLHRIGRAGCWIV